MSIYHYSKLSHSVYSVGMVSLLKPPGVPKVLQRKNVPKPVSSLAISKKTTTAISSSRMFPQNQLPEVSPKIARLVKQLFLHSAQGGAAAASDVTNAVTRDLWRGHAWGKETNLCQYSSLEMICWKVPFPFTSSKTTALDLLMKYRDEPTMTHVGKAHNFRDTSHDIRNQELKTQLGQSHDWRARASARSGIPKQSEWQQLHLAWDTNSSLAPSAALPWGPNMNNTSVAQMELAKAWTRYSTVWILKAKRCKTSKESNREIPKFVREIRETKHSYWPTLTLVWS